MLLASSHQSIDWLHAHGFESRTTQHTHSLISRSRSGWWPEANPTAPACPRAILLPLPRMGSADTDDRGSGGVGGGGSGGAPRPPPLSQWEAFKMALVAEEHFDTCYWIQVRVHTYIHMNVIPRPASLPSSPPYTHIPTHQINNPNDHRSASPRSSTCSCAASAPASW